MAQLQQEAQHRGFAEILMFITTRSKKLKWGTKSLQDYTCEELLEIADGMLLQESLQKSCFA